MYCISRVQGSWVKRREIKRETGRGTERDAERRETRSEKQKEGERGQGSDFKSSIVVVI
jgi:hypothetical protein